MYALFDPLVAFFAAIILATFLLSVLRLGPFLSLIASSLTFGILTGTGYRTLDLAMKGLGDTFSALALLIFCGAVLAEHLRQGGYTHLVMGDLLHLTRGRALAAVAASGFLLALPVMCCITAYIILEPVVGAISPERRYRFMLAVSSTIPFVMLYPSPAVVSAASIMGVDPRRTIPIGLLLSLGMLALAYIYALAGPGAALGRIGKVDSSEFLDSIEESETREIQSTSSVGIGEEKEGWSKEESEGDKIPKGAWKGEARLAAWGPLLLPVVMIPLGTLWGTLWFLSDPRVALFLASLLSLALHRYPWVKGEVSTMLSIATRRAGVILLDLCGAGALAAVVAESGISGQMGSILQGGPALLGPFLIAALMQLALGSRVVSATMAAQVLDTYPMAPELLLPALGCGILAASYMTDPFFWLVRGTSRAGFSETLRGYTLPLGICGLSGLLLLTALHFW